MLVRVSACALLCWRLLLSALFFWLVCLVAGVLCLLALFFVCWRFVSAGVLSAGVFSLGDFLLVARFCRRFLRARC